MIYDFSISESIVWGLRVKMLRAYKPEMFEGDTSLWKYTADNLWNPLGAVFDWMSAENDSSPIYATIREDLK